MHLLSSYTKTTADREIASSDNFYEKPYIIILVQSYQIAHTIRF